MFPGDKDVEIRPKPGGGTEEVEVSPERAHAICLDDRMIGAIEALLCTVEQTLEGPHDVELAFEEGRLHLLQRRDVTR